MYFICPHQRYMLHQRADSTFPVMAKGNIVFFFEIILILTVLYLKVEVQPVLNILYFFGLF